MPSRRRPAEPEYELLQHSRIRQAIGQRTQTSFRDIPQFPCVVLADVEALVGVRETRKKSSRQGLIPTYNDYFIKAVASILGQYPRLNAWHDEESLKVLKSINIGVAVATDEGVLLPTIFDADQKSVQQIAQETAELIESARRGRLRASRQQGAGFTISNLGPTVVDIFQAIISPPQTAILAIGSIKPRPMVVAETVVARASVYLNLTVSHQAADAITGASFLADLTGRLSDPEWLQQQ